MLNYIERELRQSGKEGPAQIVSGLHAVLGKDIPFPTSERTLSLEQATREYKDNPANPELLTRFMHAFWQDAGQRIGVSVTVDPFPLTAREIKEKQRKGYMAIFVPDGLDRETLGRMFPKVGGSAVREGHSTFNVAQNSGWLWIEASIDTPNKNTTQGQLEERFKKARKQGQTLKTYLVGSQVSKLLTDSYLDEGPTWSRLVSFLDGDTGRVLSFGFNPSGSLLVNAGIGPGDHNRGWLGGRSQEVIKPYWLADFISEKLEETSQNQNTTRI